jgi:hypothetical protein
MSHEDTDPHPAGPRRFVGRSVSFDYSPDGSPPRRLCGMVANAVFVGRTVRGQLPDYSLTIAGKSGKSVTVSLVESYASFSET